MLSGATGASDDPRRHQPAAGRPRRAARRHLDQLQPGLGADHRPRHRPDDPGRRVLRRRERQRAALHPRRVVHVRRDRHAGDAGRQPGHGLRPRRRRQPRRRPAAGHPGHRRAVPPCPTASSWRRTTSAATARSAASSTTASSATCASSRSPTSPTRWGWRRPAARPGACPRTPGDPELGVATEGGRGTLVGGALEMSNVDLAGRVHQPDPRPARLPGQLARDHHLRPGARGARQHQALTRRPAALARVDASSRCAEDASARRCCARRMRQLGGDG